MMNLKECRIPILTNINKSFNYLDLDDIGIIKNKIIYTDLLNEYKYIKIVKNIEFIIEDFYPWYNFNTKNIAYTKLVKISSGFAYPKEKIKYNDVDNFLKLMDQLIDDDSKRM